MRWSHHLAGVVLVAMLALLVPFARPANAAISWVSSSHNRSESSTLNVSKPANVQTGDLLVVGWTIESGTGWSSPSNQPPVGWTLINATDSTATSSDVGLITAYRFVQSSDGASFSFTTNGKKQAAGITAYRGVDASSPVLAKAAAGAASGTITAPGVTSTPGTRLAIFASKTSSGHSTPTGMTQRVVSTASDFRTSAYDQVHAAQGPTGSAAGASASGAWAAATIVLGVGASAPAAPSASPGAGVAATQFTAKWTASTDASSYRLDVSTTADFSEPVSGYSNLDVGNVTSHEVTGVAPGTTYHYRVRAVNTIGASASSNIVEVTTVVAAPGAPTGLDAKAGDGQVELTWMAPTDGGPAASYVVERWDATTSDWVEVAHSITGTGYTVTPLDNGTSYEFRVRAVNAGGDSASGSATATPKQTFAAPGSPANLEAQPGDGQVILTWDDADGDVDGYVVQVYDGEDWVDAGLDAKSPQTVTDLTNGQKYRFRVVATGPGGTSEASNEADATPKADIQPPGAPGGLDAEAGDRQVVVSWTKPSTGGEVVSYTVEYRTVEGDWTLAETTSDLASTVTGLDNGTEYEFRVRANGPEQSSDYAGPVSATPEAPEQPPAVPGEPLSLTATPGDSEVSLTWAKGDGGEVSTYVVEFSLDGMIWTKDTVTADTSHMVDDLHNGTTYHFRVRATGPGGDSDWVEQKATPTAKTKESVIVPSVPTVPTIPTAPPPTTTTTTTPPTTAPAPGPEPAPHPQPTIEMILDGEVVAGGDLRVYGRHFMPGNDVELTMYSTPTYLGSAPVRADGTFDRTVTIPAGTTGTHRIEAVGIGYDGSRQVASLTFTIGEPVAETQAPEAPAPPAPSAASPEVAAPAAPQLPRTGGGVGMLVAMGAWLLGMGVALQLRSIRSGRRP